MIMIIAPLPPISFSFLLLILLSCTSLLHITFTIDNDISDSMHCVFYKYPAFNVKFYYTYTCIYMTGSAPRQFHEEFCFLHTYLTFLIKF